MEEPKFTVVLKTGEETFTQEYNENGLVNYLVSLTNQLEVTPNMAVGDEITIIRER